MTSLIINNALSVLIWKLFLFQYLKVHLEFLQFLLKEGDIYLAWPRCKDIWDTLVANPKASGYDKEVGKVLGLAMIIMVYIKQ